MSRFQFVADTPPPSRCGAHRSTRGRPGHNRPGPLGRPDARLEVRIREVRAADNTVGAPRMTAELDDGAPDCERVNHKWVLRVMRGAGIAGFPRAH